MTNKSSTYFHTNDGHHLQSPQFLGDGLFSVVFKVKDGTGNEYILKLLRPTMADNVGTFIKEVNILQVIENIESQTRTHHVPRVIDFGSHHQLLAKWKIVDDAILSQNPPFYILQELTKGRKLSEIKNELTANELLIIFEQLATFLELLYLEGIVNPDIKINHIFWDGREVQLIDWNVAFIRSAKKNDFENKTLSMFVNLSKLFVWLITRKQLSGSQEHMIEKNILMFRSQHLPVDEIIQYLRGFVERDQAYE